MFLHVAGINPEPWTAPEVSIGRKNGKPFPMVYKTETLRVYQEAVRDSLSAQGGIEMLPGDQPFRLHFWLWRQLPDYEIGDGRKSRRHVADATNLQKALEDALQGILFKNDRWCLHITTSVVDQGEDVIPGIVIEIEPLRGAIVPLTTKNTVAKVQHHRDLILNESTAVREEDPRANLDVSDIF